VPVQRRLALQHREAARHAAAARLALSSGRLRRPEVSAARRDAAAAPPGFRPRARLAMAQAGSAELPFQASLPAAAWRHRAAHPSDARRAEESEPLEPWVWTALSLLPEVSALLAVPWCVRVAPRWGQRAVACARVVRPWAEAAAPDVAQRQEVAASDAAAGPRQEAAAVWDAAAAQQPVVGVAARDAEALRLAGLDVRAAVRPSAAAWVFRRGPILPWFPARRRAARSAHAMRKLRAASRSVPTWQAA
jgi:hypothetical protein